MAASSSQVFQQIVLDGIHRHQGNGLNFELRCNEPVWEEHILSVVIDVKAAHSMFGVGVLCNTMEKALKIRDNSNVLLCDSTALAEELGGERVMIFFNCIGITAVINIIEDINDHALKLSEGDIRRMRFSIYDLMSDEELACYVDANQDNSDLLEYICSRADKPTDDGLAVDTMLQDLETRQSILIAELERVQKEINTLLSTRHPQSPTVTASGVKTLFSNNAGSSASAVGQSSSNTGSCASEEGQSSFKTTLG